MGEQPIATSHVCAVAGERVTVRLTPADQVDAKRRALLIRMQIVCMEHLDERPAYADPAGAYAATVVLETLMNDMPGGRAAFAGDDGWRPFRELAWDAAERLLVTQLGQALWARILREVLQAMPEVDALAA